MFTLSVGSYLGFICKFMFELVIDPYPIDWLSISHYFFYTFLPCTYSPLPPPPPPCSNPSKWNEKKNTYHCEGMDVSFSGILSYLEEKAEKLISSREYTKVGLIYRLFDSNINKAYILEFLWELILFFIVILKNRRFDVFIWCRRTCATPCRRPSSRCWLRPRRGPWPTAGPRRFSLLEESAAICDFR